MTNAIRVFLIFLRGMGMGAADVVPGVSGGTVAFITGIYDKLVETINRIDHRALKFLLKGNIKGLLEHVNWKFIVPLFLGIVIAIFTLAGIISHLLETQRVLLWAFFFGLIAASALVILQQIDKWNYKKVLLLIAGTIVAVIVTSFSLFVLPDGNFFLFIGGAIAIMAMILPGVSGSYLLLLMGKYEEVIGIVSNFASGAKELVSGLKSFDTAVLGQTLTGMPWLPFMIFLSGCVVGLISFAKFLNWLLKNFYQSTMAVLTGFLIGSLNLVWPWKETLSWRVSSDGSLKPLAEKNILPPAFDNHFLLAVGLAIAGFLLVYVIHKVAQKKKEVVKS